MPRKTERRSALDPAVAEILGGLERKQQLAELPIARRGKARRDAARHRVGMDLPPALHDELREIAGTEQVSVSGLAAFLLRRSIEEYRTGRLALRDHKYLARSPRFEFVLRVDEKGE